MLFVGLLSSSVVRATEPIALCYDDTDNFPWLVKDGQGLLNAVVNLAAAKSGVGVVQTPLPWKRCLFSIANGDVAGGFAASYSDERAAFAVYPLTADGRPDAARRIKSDGYSLYRLKGMTAHWNGSQFVDLTGRVGSQLGYASTAELKQHGATVVEFRDKPGVAMRHLLLRDIQMLALMTHDGDAQMNDPKIAALVEKVASPFIEKPYFVIFNKAFYAANKKTVEDFWSGLAAARESAEFQRQLADRLKLIPKMPVVK
jgi:polar amino acid transport system substrate-binding protein